MVDVAALGEYVTSTLLCLNSFHLSAVKIFKTSWEKEPAEESQPIHPKEARPS
jgi:hypothetical protein